MEENKQEIQNVNEASEKIVIAPNLKEILDKIEKNKELSSEQITLLQNEAKNSLEFMEIVKKIELPKDNYVIFTDGDEQLIYENGEFFIVATTDSTKEKKKKKRLEAKDMYIEYFIRYTLNKINTKAPKTVEKDKSNKSKEVKKVEKNVQEKQKNQKEISDKRAEEIKESLKNMVAPVTEDYERSKIINKIKNGNENFEKTR